MKDIILSHYNDSSFDLEKIYIGVTVLEKSDFKLKIYNNFTCLEDAIDCCIASSHIPFVTGGPFNMYRNRLSFDGGFFNYPYLNISSPALIIAPDIWENTTSNKNSNLTIINCNLETIINLAF